jgi:hypothetical protein
MKKNITIGLSLVLFIGMIFPQYLHAQAEQNTSFLFRDSKYKLSTFYAEVNPGTSFSSLNNQSVSVFEVTGGFILNNSIYFGFFTAGSPKINKVQVPEQGSEKYNEWLEAGVKLNSLSSSTELLFVNFRHAGLEGGYMHKTYKPVFWKAGLQFGFSGGLNMSESQSFLGLFDNMVFKTKIITLEPNVGLGINLLEWWRIHVDAGYRFMSVDERILDATETDSFTLKLGFVFGNFRYK